jgi:hypothetical protein
MDITPQDDSQQSISDDQELAKALAGVLPDVPEPVVVETAPDPIESTPAPTTAEPASDVSSTSFDTTSTDAMPASPVELDGIKKDALKELRPLIGKVDLPPQEKFDTYLMLIRSTDDSSLIAPAHVVAQSIADETNRAEALLDIIKEIDYLSRNNQQPTI